MSSIETVRKRYLKIESTTSRCFLRATWDVFLKSRLRDWDVLRSRPRYRDVLRSRTRDQDIFLRSRPRDWDISWNRSYDTTRYLEIETTRSRCLLRSRGLDQNHKDDTTITDTVHKYNILTLCLVKIAITLVVAKLYFL